MYYKPRSTPTPPGGVPGPVPAPVATSTPPHGGVPTLGSVPAPVPAPVPGSVPGTVPEEIDPLARVLARSGALPNQKLATWQVYMPPVIAGVIALYALFNVGTWFGMRLNRPAVDDTQGLLYMTLILLPAILAGFAIHFLFTGSPTSRTGMAVMIGLSFVGLIAVGFSLGGIGPTVPFFIIQAALLPAIFTPGSSLYSPGGTIKPAHVMSIGGSLIGVGALLGTISVFYPLGIPSLMSQQKTLDDDTRAYLQQMNAWADGSEPTKPSPSLLAHKDEIMEKLLAWEKDAKYLRQLGDYEYAPRAYMRVRLAYLYMAWIFEVNPAILRDRCNEMRESITRYEEAMAKNPAVTTEEIEALLQEAYVLLKRLSFSV